MTVENLHDALTLLPGDLVRAADKARTQQKNTRPQWKRVAAMAACLVLVLGSGMVFLGRLLPAMGGSAKSTAQAPAAAAPAMPEEARDEMSPAETMTPSAEPASPGEGHNHGFAGEENGSIPETAYSGNGNVVLYTGDQTVTLTGRDAAAASEILDSLPYGPELVCRCAGEFTVDTEMRKGIQVNLTEGFARCEQGQANLTREQAKTLQDILDGLQ